MRSVGMRTAREGLRWHLIESQPGKYDFSSALRIHDAAQSQGVQIIWDLLHFGWPEWLDVFTTDWLQSFGEFAAAFAKVLAKETSGTPFVAPVNEISFVSWAGGDVEYINPFSRGRGPELKRQLVRAVLLSSDAVRAEIPAVRLVAPEPVIHIVGDPTQPEDVLRAAEYRLSMFESWDWISGRAQPELGGHPSYLDIIGINYYNRNQWWNHGEIIWLHDPEYRPFREILMEVHARYQRPMFIAETGTEDEDRPAWLAYIAAEAFAARRAGAELHGICLYPILNHPGWDDDRHCKNGLWDYPQPDGSREIYQPLAAELARQQLLEGEIYEPTTDRTNSARPDLPVASALEFRVPTTPAPDVAICAGGTGVLCRGASI